ncbi:MAG: FmdB family zinc ribbon protein [Methermicoccaceae archaeon]
MPVYEYECKKCGQVMECVSKIKEKPAWIPCMCGYIAKPIISKVADMKADWEPYIDENLGDEPVEVRGRGHRRELMKKAGLEEVSYSKNRAEIREKMEHWRIEAKRRRKERG